jgi:Fur family ferric uptake transcriptional regulator
MAQKSFHTETLSKFLSEKGLKKTHQRDIISKIFFSSPPRHYRIEELLEKSRKYDSSISYATVYRTLMMFIEAGVAYQRQFGKGQSLFEQAGEHHHDHLICTECDEIVEFENDTIEKLQDEVAKKHGFTLTRHKMELYGVCRKCGNH